MSKKKSNKTNCYISFDVLKYEILLYMSNKDIYLMIMKITDKKREIYKNAGYYILLQILTSSIPSDWDYDKFIKKYVNPIRMSDYPVQLCTRIKTLHNNKIKILYYKIYKHSSQRYTSKHSDGNIFYKL